MNIITDEFGRFRLAGAVSDVHISSGGRYVGAFSRLDINGVILSAQTDGSLALNFEGGSVTLAGLTDVAISSPTEGQTLVYNAATGKWENGSAGLFNPVDHIEFDLTPTTTSGEGVLFWDAINQTLAFGLPGGNVTLQIGQEIPIRVLNDDPTDLVDGDLVYISGATGSNHKVKKAQANAESTSATTFGMATEPIASGHHGYITTFGVVHAVNTDPGIYAAGDVLYLSPTIAGGFTRVKPSAPNHAVVVGQVIRAHASNGEIFVQITNGLELDELHDVLISGSAAGDMLIAGSAGTWANHPLTGDASLTSGGALTIVGGAITFAKQAPLAGLSVIGNSGSASATPQALTAGSVGQVLRRASSGSSLAFGAVDLASANAITGILPVANGGTGGSAATAITALTGDVTATGPGSVAATIAAGAVTLPKLASGSAASVLGVSGSAATTPAWIQAAEDGQILRRSGANVDFGAIALASGSAVSGVLGTANGGTGGSSLAAAGLARGAGTLTASTGNDATIVAHTHAITASANPGAATSLLKSDASGYLQLARLGIGVSPTSALMQVYGSVDGEVGYWAQNALTSGSKSAVVHNILAGSTIAQLVATNEIYNHGSGYGAIASSLQIINRSGPLVVKTGGYLDSAIRLYISSTGNILVGTTSAPSGGGTPVMSLGQASSSPTGIPLDTASLFVKDVGGVANLFAINDGGVETQITGAGGAVTGTGAALQLAYWASSGSIGSGSGLVSHAGNLGVGGASANSLVALNASKTFVETSGGLYGVNSNIVPDPPGTSSAIYRGFRGGVRSGNSLAQNLTGAFYGLEADVRHRGSGTLAQIIGVLSTVGIDNAGVGAVTSVYGVVVGDLLNSSGSITNTYGMYIGDLSTGTQVNPPWSIYSADGTARMYHAGAVLIGTTTPPASGSALLSIARSASAPTGGAADSGLLFVKRLTSGSGAGAATDAAICVQAAGSTYEYELGRHAKLPGGQQVKVRTVSANYTAQDSDYVLLCTGGSAGITVTLPAAANVSGAVLHIKKTDSGVGTITVDGNGSETIDGALTQVIALQYDSMQIVCDGTGWNII